MSPTWEALHINRTKKFVESGTVLRILGEVLIDHVKGGLKYSFQNCRNLRCEQWLKLNKNVHRRRGEKDILLIGS